MCDSVRLGVLQVPSQVLFETAECHAAMPILARFCTGFRLARCYTALLCWWCRYSTHSDCWDATVAVQALARWPAGSLEARAEAQVVGDPRWLHEAKTCRWVIDRYVQILGRGGVLRDRATARIAPDDGAL